MLSFWIFTLSIISKLPVLFKIMSTHIHLNILYYSFEQVGKALEMISMYDKALKMYEEDEAVDEEAISIRYEKVCRVV